MKPIPEFRGAITRANWSGDAPPVVDQHAWLVYTVVIDPGFRIKRKLRR